MAYIEFGFEPSFSRFAVCVRAFGAGRAGFSLHAEREQTDAIELARHAGRGIIEARSRLFRFQRTPP